MFGICLGHQIIAEALGIPTYKMHHGHRGCNHPVMHLETGLCEVTTQNHGFSVKIDDLRSSGKAELTHINLNDGTVEGFAARGAPILGIQHHPEASPGPHDAAYLFDCFVAMMRSGGEPLSDACVAACQRSEPASV